MVGYKNREGIVFVIGLIMWGAVIAMFLYLTVLAGFRRDWVRMGLCLYLFIFVVFHCVGILLDLKIHSCFKRLDHIIPRKLGSTPLKWETPPAPLLILLVLFAACMVPVSLHLALRQQWLTLCVLLTVLAIYNFIFMGLKIALSIKGYSKRLEKLISTCVGTNVVSP